jgi:orotate phosphoribosyltransferase
MAREHIAAASAAFRDLVMILNDLTSTGPVVRAAATPDVIRQADVRVQAAMLELRRAVK